MVRQPNQANKLDDLKKTVYTKTRQPSGRLFIPRVDGLMEDCLYTKTTCQTRFINLSQAGNKCLTFPTWYTWF